MRLDKLTLKSREALESAHRLASEKGHPQIEPEHVLQALLDAPEGVVSAILGKLGADRKAIARDVAREVDRLPQVSGGAEVGLGRRMQAVVNAAFKEAEGFKDDYVSVEHLLLAIAEEKGSAAAQVLKEAGVTRDALLRALQEVRGSHRVTDPNAEERYQALERYGKDLTDLARQGKLDPVIGRDDEIRRVIQVLSRRTKNNPVLIGEPGVRVDP